MNKTNNGSSNQDSGTSVSEWLVTVAVAALAIFIASGSLYLCYILISRVLQ